MFRNTDFGEVEGLDAGGCFRVILNPGDVVYMPGGVMHYVVTPKDSIVFGSNLLLLSNIEAIAEQYVRERLTDVKEINCFQDIETLAMLVFNDNLKNETLDNLVDFMHKKKRFKHHSLNYLSVKVS